MANVDSSELAKFASRAADWWARLQARPAFARARIEPVAFRD